MKYPIRKGGSRVVKALIIALIAAFFLIAYEITLRIRGIAPFKPRIHNVIYEPEFIFAPDLKLGYKLKPGAFKFTFCDLDSFSFSPVHGLDSTRITRPRSNEANYLDKKRVYIYGASYTYGLGVEDSLTFPFQFQNAFSNLNVYNYGIPGYAPIHALLLLKQSIQANLPPSIVVINYSHYQDDTNTLPRKKGESMLRFSNKLNKPFIEHSAFPHAVIEENGELLIDYTPCGSLYSEWPLRRYSSLVNFLEIKYNDYEASQYDSREVTKRILLEINKVCLNRGISLIVAGINNADLTRDMLVYCASLGILTLDISVDLSDKSRYRIHPNDAHPNELAHTEYANAYIEYFNARPELLPELSNLKKNGSIEQIDK